MLIYFALTPIARTRPLFSSHQKSADTVLTHNSAERVVLASISDDRSGRKDGRYRESQLEIQHLLKQTNHHYGITDYFMWTYDNITRTEVYAENRQLFDNQNADLSGRAYKPLTIYHALMTIDEGDYLIYSDCSPEMWNGYNRSVPFDNSYDIKVLKDLVNENGGILTSAVFWHHEEYSDFTNKTSLGYKKDIHWRRKTGDIKTDIGDHTHALFTTDACIDTMRLGRYRDSFQHASGIIVIRKSYRSVRFVTNWLHWNLNPKCATVIPFHNEATRKLGHRTDQSISGLLINEMNGSLLIPFADGLHNPYNFLQWSRTGVHYEFINSNANPKHTRWSGWESSQSNMVRRDQLARLALSKSES